MHFLEYTIGLPLTATVNVRFKTKGASVHQIPSLSG